MHTIYAADIEGVLYRKSKIELLTEYAHQLWSFLFICFTSVRQRKPHFTPFTWASIVSASKVHEDRFHGVV